MRARRAALVVIACLVAASTLVAFGESYRALYLWALRHGVPGGWALIWPAMVDTFVCVGELALFVALTDRWTSRSRVFAWSVTLAGLAVSVAANVGHVASHALTSRATAAVPPVAAAAALAVGLGVLKRVVERHHALAPGTAPAPEAPLEVLPETTPEVLPAAPEATLHPALTAVPDVEERPQMTPGKQPGPATPERLAEFYATDLAKGKVPSKRQIKREWPVGYETASDLYDELAARAAP
jgi:hypothetical protein